MNALSDRAPGRTRETTTHSFLLFLALAALQALCQYAMAQPLASTRTAPPWQAIPPNAPSAIPTFQASLVRLLGPGNPPGTLTSAIATELPEGLVGWPPGRIALPRGAVQQLTPRPPLPTMQLPSQVVAIPELVPEP